MLYGIVVAYTYFSLLSFFLLGRYVSTMLIKNITYSPKNVLVKMIGVLPDPSRTAEYTTRGHIKIKSYTDIEQQTSKNIIDSKK